jgi:hypothetical protein
MTITPSVRTSDITRRECVGICRWLRTDAADGGAIARPASAVVTNEHGTRFLVPALSPEAANQALEAFDVGVDPTVAFDASSAVPLQEGFDDALALLAADLAVAKAVLASKVLPRAPAVVVLLGYSVRAALLHAEMTVRQPDTHVTVLDSSPMRRAVAEAFGADAPRPGPDVPAVGGLVFVLPPEETDLSDLQRFPVIELGDSGIPDLADIALAISTIQATEWRFRPFLTSVAARCLGEPEIDPQGGIAAAVLL